MHIFQPKTPTELKKFRKVEMKKQIVNWLITNGSIDTTERELDEFTGYVVGALQPIVLAVYRVLCPHLFCKFSDDLKGML